MGSDREREQHGDVAGTCSAHMKGLAPLQSQPAGREGQGCWVQVFASGGKM